MPDHKEFTLGDYVEVKDRIALFYEMFGQGRLVTEEVRATTEPDGKPRIWVKAAAYRTVDDAHPGIGWSWMELPGTTPYTKGSELENTETSAWGRAIASLGILILKGIATGNEVASKAAPKPPRAPQTAAAPRPAEQPTNTPPVVSDEEVAGLVETIAPSGGMTITELQRRAAAATIGVSDLNAKSRELFDKTINLLTNEQRQKVAEEVGIA
jgi:hypothetical protein